MTEKLTLKELYDLYTMEHGLASKKPRGAKTKINLLLTGKSKAKTVTSATRGVPLTPDHVKPYLHQILSGEIDAVVFRGYGEEKTSLMIRLAPPVDGILEEIYQIEVSRGMRMSQVHQLTGIPVTQFVLVTNTSLKNL